MRPPPISIRCDCGDARSVPYGESWECDGCGRRWNTAQIPPEEYWGIIREVRRHRRLVLGVAVVVVGAMLPLAIVLSQRFLLLMIILLGSFAFYVLPFLRRRLRRRLGELPRWNLHPE